MEGFRFLVTVRGGLLGFRVGGLRFSVAGSRLGVQVFGFIGVSRSCNDKHLFLILMPLK